MREGPRVALLVLEYTVCMIVPSTFALIGVGLGMGLLPVGGVIGSVGAFWALVRDMNAGRPPRDVWERVFMGALIAVGCGVVITWLALTGFDGLVGERLPFALAFFGLPLVHGLRRLVWLARPKASRP